MNRRSKFAGIAGALSNLLILLLVDVFGQTVMDSSSECFAILLVETGIKAVRSSLNHGF